MSFADEKDGERRRKPEDAGPNADSNASGSSAPALKKQKKKPETPEVGNALRSAYQRTLDEDIPPEMMDLLGKLG